jgi:hypothetical protein
MSPSCSGEGGRGAAARVRGSRRKAAASGESFMGGRGRGGGRTDAREKDLFNGDAGVGRDGVEG